MALKQIYAIEVSGACNLEERCRQCPMHNRPRSRKRGLMNSATVERALYYVKKLRTNGETLFLHVFGEPLLHPNFDDIAMQFSSLMPISMSTNGVLLDAAWADRLAKVPWAWISLSPWDEAAMLRAARLLEARHIRVKYAGGATHDWAGQAQEGKGDLRFRGGCPYLTKEKCVIRWDGSLATCCITDREEDTIGHIDQEPEDVSVRPYSLCDTCHHARGY